MRTSVDLPSELFRRAKARAAERGETLRELLTRAVEAEVGRSRSDKLLKEARVKLPLFGDSRGSKFALTNDDIERILAEEEAAVASPFVSRRRKKR
jgi:hypothetical protein